MENLINSFPKISGNSSIGVHAPAYPIVIFFN